MGRKVEHKKKNSYTADNFNKYDPKLSYVARESPKFTFPQGRRYNSKENDASEQMFYHTVDSKAGGYSYSMGTAKRFGELKKDAKGRQHPLLAWLTDKDQNRHFDQDIETTDKLFFINESGVLYAVLDNMVGAEVISNTLKLTVK